MKNMKIWLLVSCMALTSSTALCMKFKIRPLIIGTALVGGSYAGKKLFFESNLDLYLKSTDYLINTRTFLGTAAEELYLKKYESLKPDADRKTLDEYGYNLDHAIKIGSLKLVKLLIENGVKVNNNPIDRYTPPLSLAVKCGNLEIAKFLIEHGANVNINNYNNPLSLAVKSGNLEIAKFLVEYGANANSNINEDTPLILAAKGGDLEIAKFLIENDANVNAKMTTRKTYGGSWDDDGYDGYVEIEHYTPLSFAIAHNNMDLITLLIASDAVVCKETTHGYSIHDLLFFVAATLFRCRL